MEAFQEKRSYDPENPHTWTPVQLLRFLRERGVDVKEGAVKAELIRMVDEHMTNDILREEVKKRMALQDGKVDVSSKSAEELITYRAYPPYATALRKDVKKLQDIIRVGMAQLTSLTAIAELRNAECHPPLEAWLYTAATGTDAGKSFHHALTAHSTSSVCGKYFKSRDMVVRCLDCGADPTCVMCMECFQNSPCRNHRYAVTAGSGGGMCDCGDPTAWKPEGFCSRHRGVKEGDDPTAAMPAADKEWATTILRGMVQFVTLVLQQSLALSHKVGSTPKTSSSLNRPEASCGHPEEGLAATEEELPKILPYLSQRDWLADWLAPIASALVALTSDCAKRLVGSLWLEPTPLPSAHLAASHGTKEASCLELLFLYQLHRDETEGAKTEKKDTPWWNELLQGVGLCLSDPTFRTPFAATHLTYAERVEQSRGRLASFTVQFMTNPTTVGELMLASPSALPYAEPHDTVIHRALSAMVYLLAKVARDPASDKSRKLPASLPLWLFRLRWSTHNLSAQATQLLTYSVMASREAAAAAVLSRSFLRVLLQVLIVLQASADVRRDPETATSEPNDAYWLGNLLNRLYWCMQTAQRQVLRSLGEGKGLGLEHEQHLLAVLEKANGFDPVPDKGLDCAAMTSFMAGAAAPVTGDEPSPVLVTPSRQGTEAPYAYMEAYMKELLRGVDTAMLLLRSDFQKIGYGNSTVVLRGSAVPIHAYRLMEPETHSTSFMNSTVRLLCLAMRAWTLESRRRQQAALKSMAKPEESANKEAEGGHATARVRLGGLDLSALSEAEATPPLKQISSLAFAGDEASAVRRESVLDSLVMPHALMAQVELGWWARGDCNVVDLTQRYLGLEAGMVLHQDMYMLQVLALHTPTQEYALRILERLSFSPPPKATKGKKQGKKGSVCPHAGGGGGGVAALRPGWQKFFRLMLTIILDTRKANRVISSDFSQALVTAVVAGYLALAPAPHSRLLNLVQYCFRGVDADEMDTDEEGHGIQSLVTKAVEEVAQAEDRPGGSVFRIKDTMVWRRHVHIYLPETLDAEVDDGFLVNYSRLHVIECLQARKDAGDGDAAGKLPTARLPPPSLPNEVQYEELIPPLRALLHTDAMLVPAIQVVLQHAHNLRGLRAKQAHSDSKENPSLPHRGASSASMGDSSETDEEYTHHVRTPRSAREEEENEEDISCSDAEDDEDDEEDRKARHHVSPHLLLHAITALYLCIQDCAAITQAANAELGVAGASGTALPVAGGDVPEVDWGRVEAYVRDTIAPTCSFSRDSVKALFPLPELTGAQSIKAKLARKVAASRFRSPAVDAEAPRREEKNEEHSDNATSSSGSEPMYSAVQALHELRDYLKHNEKEDRYSLCAMIEFILLGTGLAEFSPESTAEESAADAKAAAEARSRQQRVKDKQAKLLAQLRSRGAKKSAAVTGAKDAASTAEDASKGSNATPHLHTKLLLELTSLECCVCRSSTEEPLMLLANTSSSGVLNHLRAMPLPDERTVHSHLHVCGHAAHKTCTEKLFKRLSELWRRGMFQGERFLGAGEFSCPVCVMICTALCPVPVLSTSTSSATASDKATTLFEDIRRSTITGKPKVVQEACAELHNALANASVGISPAGDDATPIVKSEDELQKAGSAAWQLSETIRTVGYHLQLMLESAKADLNSLTLTTQRDCVTLLALLVSLDPAQLATHRKALEKNFTRTREDFSLLVLRTLLEPGKAAAHIAAYARALTASSEPIKTFLDRCTASAADAHEAVDTGADTAVGMALWKELGCLTLLKLVLSDDDATSASSALVLAGPPTPEAAAEQPHLVVFVTLNSSVLASPEGRREAVRRMWSFLLPGAEATSPEPTDSRLTRLPLLPVTPAGLSPYASPAAHRIALTEQLLHLPSEYVDVLARHTDAKGLCSQCKKHSQKPVLCCFCGKYFCLQPDDTAPELYEHSRVCGGGVGLYLIVRATVLVVLDAVAGRVLQYTSIYTDEHGETDVGLQRGRRLTRNETLAKELLSHWLRNRWGTDSSTVKQSWRYGVKRM